jgi:hypothetical protein
MEPSFEHSMLRLQADVSRERALVGRPVVLISELRTRSGEAEVAFALASFVQVAGTSICQYCR